ncbi:MAG TPA: helix-hairpin-helix domain-containing protein, partial [Desulfosporosinus sp.]|nr:helix-hairpin-helix domain-containing protein [Desulfosporosinus sp.]
MVNIRTTQTYAPRDSPVNINTASPQALESLPGIGKVLAKRIIQGRPYSDVREIDRVKG